MECYRPVKVDVETANIPKVKEYQLLHLGGYDLEEDQNDLYIEGSDSEKLSNTASVRLTSEDTSSDETSESSYSLEAVANWWHSD